MALSLDGSATGTFTIGGVLSTTATVTLSTTNTNDIIVVVVALDDPAVQPAVSTVSATGLTFVKRSSKTLTASNGNLLDLEVWWALSTGALTNKVITVTVVGLTGPDSGTVIGFGVTGANTTTPWDVNASLPKINTDTAGNTQTGSAYSTTAANTMLLMFAMIDAIGTYVANTMAGTTGTLIKTISDVGNINPGNSSGVEYRIVSAAQSSVTDKFNFSYILFSDAIQAASAVTLVTGWQNTYDILPQRKSILLQNSTFVFIPPQVTFGWFVQEKTFFPLKKFYKDEPTFFLPVQVSVVTVPFGWWNLEPDTYVKKRTFFQDPTFISFLPQINIGWFSPVDERPLRKQYKDFIAWEPQPLIQFTPALTGWLNVTSDTYLKKRITVDDPTFVSFIPKLVFVNNPSDVYKGSVQYKDEPVFFLPVQAAVSVPILLGWLIQTEEGVRKLRQILDVPPHWELFVTTTPLVTPTPHFRYFFADMGRMMSNG